MHTQGTAESGNDGRQDPWGAGAAQGSQHDPWQSSAATLSLSALWPETMSTDLAIGGYQCPSHDAKATNRIHSVLLQHYKLDRMAVSALRMIHRLSPKTRM